MTQGYHSPPDDAASPGVPGVALRRHTDRCFFAVEEVVYEADDTVRGYIVQGVLVDKDDVAEVRPHRNTDCTR